MSEMKRTFPEKLKTFGMRRVINYLDKDLDKNAPKILDWLGHTHKVDGQVNTVRKAIEDKDGNWYKLVKSLWTDVDDGVRKTMFENFILNATVIGGPRQDRYAEKYNCNIPWAMLMDPTSACNLHCIGCWAAEYGNRLNLTFEELDDVIEQGVRMGTFFYIFSGGEPLVRKKDIIRLCEKHPECQFLSFTNGTLIDEQFADDMLRVKNFIPAISIEGFEEATDARRGKGTYQKVIDAMALLKAKKLPFGISCCYTSQNYDVIGSEEYFDQMCEMGAKFAWFFTYMPVGRDAVPELMATPEQRRFMYDAIRRFRHTKPIFTLDFWNDGEYVDGCIAGGRRYLHINAAGDIEPCAFIHYSDCNIRDTKLIDAFRKPLFQAYHDNQPFNQNHLRPCPLLDNPQAIQKMVDETGARSTDVMAPEDVHVLAAKTEAAAAAWAPVADEMWEHYHYCKGAACKACAAKGRK